MMTKEDGGILVARYFSFIATFVFLFIQSAISKESSFFKKNPTNSMLTEAPCFRCDFHENIKFSSRMVVSFLPSNNAISPNYLISFFRLTDYPSTGNFITTKGEKFYLIFFIGFVDKVPEINSDSILNSKEAGWVEFLLSGKRQIEEEIKCSPDLQNVGKEAIKNSSLDIKLYSKIQLGLELRKFFSSLNWAI